MKQRGLNNEARAGKSGVRIATTTASQWGLLLCGRAVIGARALGTRMAEARVRG